MKKKILIVWAIIFDLIIIVYTSHSIYNYYNNKDKQLAVKNEPSDTKNTESTKVNMLPPASRTEVKETFYRLGDKGFKIIEIQERLVKYGYMLKIDGNYGNDTFKAICDFQRRLGIPVDGIVGPETLAKLNEDPAKKTK